MNRFFYDVKQKAAKMAKSAVDGSEKAVESLKVNVTIYDKEQKIRTMYEEFGRSMYKSMREGLQLDEEFGKKTCEEIYKELEELNEMKLRLSELRNYLLCPNCKTKLSKDSNYCFSCGEKIKE